MPPRDNHHSRIAVGLVTVAFVFAFLAPVLQSAQLPVRVFTWDAAPATETVNVTVPGGANPAAWFYARIHNVRFGGQVSFRVNGGDWITVYNHTVSILEPERSQGGIGGVNGTIRFVVPLSPGDVVTGVNTISFRLNGTDGIVSGIRVVDLDFLEAAFARILPPGELTQEDPNTWMPPSPDPADIAAGAALWTNGVIVNDSVNGTPIKAKCASCHFADGSDLKYFNYSNGSIISRSRFHGLTQQQGEQIASYIRSSTKPNPGRPWNPPFQPGAGLDPDPGDDAATRQQKAQSWMAGAGLSAGALLESQMLPHIFPEGTSPAAIAKVIDHEKNFSVREIPVPIQFPDWNNWLPDIAPEDMWPTAFYYDQPYALYTALRNTLNTTGVAALTAAGQLNATFEDFNMDLRNWYGGDFRLVDMDPANEPAVSLARNPWLSREDVVRSLVKWMAIKMMEVVRDYDLEDEHDAFSAGDPMYEPELLAIPGGGRLSIVFAHAPHIISDNWLNFEHQPENLGKMESNQWYHLQLCLNSGFRTQVNMNVPLDWDYQLLHLQSASERGGRWFGLQRLITHIKMYQSRDNGAGIRISGFSMRTLVPWRLYSDSFRDRSLHKGALDALEPGLWRKCFEEFMYEWMDVVESMDLNDPVLVPRSMERHELEPATYVPVPWGGGTAKYFQHPSEVYADLMYRLLPLLPADGIDEMLLTDLREWCKLAWPLGNWDSLFGTTALYYENFEDGLSDFALTNAVLTPAAIKDANYVNTYVIGPKNGGGAFVAQRGLTAAATRQGINDTINLPLNGATRLRLKARTAFRDDDGVDPGVVSFKMRLRFDGAAAEHDAEDVVVLDPDLYDVEFESYDSYLDVPPGATNITRLSVWWERAGGAGAGTVYADNIQILPIDETPDTTPPGAPVLTNITKPSDLRLRANWSATNPAGDGVVGYNVYRWRNGDPVSSKIKLNTGLVDNPYIWFEDYTVMRGTTYNYHVTALDKAGNESAPSNSRSNTLPDTEAPPIPGTLFASSGGGIIDLGWFGVTSWDVAAYDVYRREAGEPAFTMLTTMADPAETLFFSDPGRVGGVTYEYYVEAFDLVGNLSGASGILSIESIGGGSPLELWKQSFNGVNGWDAGNPAISGNEVDFDGDGLGTIWEYLVGGNPAVADSASVAFPDSDVVDVSGSDYLQASYERQETFPPGIVVVVQLTNDLVDWSNEFVVEGDAPGAGIAVIVGAPAGGKRTIAVRQNVPIGDPGAFRFMRFLAREASQG